MRQYKVSCNHFCYDKFNSICIEWLNLIEYRMTWSHSFSNFYGLREECLRRYQSEELYKRLQVTDNYFIKSYNFICISVIFLYMFSLHLNFFQWQRWFQIRSGHNSKTYEVFDKFFQYFRYSVCMVVCHAVCSLFNKSNFSACHFHNLKVQAFWQTYCGQTHVKKFKVVLKWNFSDVL